MKHTILWCIALGIIQTTSHANCDLTQYPWDCDINIHIRPTATAHSLVYCGNSYGYVTKQDYDQLARYQRASVNMSLTVNDSYLTGPCVPAGR